MPCNVEMLAGIEFFEMLGEDDRTALASVIDYEKLEAGQALFQAGQQGEALFIVHSGEIELYIKDTTGSLDNAFYISAALLLAGVALSRVVKRPLAVGEN